MAQLELPFVEARRAGLEPKRLEPSVWVSRVLVLRELRLDAVVREIRLRRGLNILWARPSPAAEPRLNEGGLSGHTAGKTTFCRLIRYLLGEQRFAAPRVQERVRTGPLRDGWVVGQVHVAGEPWVVGRPFALHVHPFAARGASIEDAIAKGGPFQDFTLALDDATTAALPARMLPVTGRPIDWPLLLTWLTRDQEARFAAPEEWRSPRSESDSPSPPVIDRATVIRSVLDVVSDDEARLQRQWEELDRAKDELDRAATAAEVRGTYLRRRLAGKLSLPEQTLEEGALFVQAAAAEVAQRRREAESSRAATRLAREEVARAEATRDEAVREHAELTGQLTVLRRQQASAAHVPPAARRASKERLYTHGMIAVRTLPTVTEEEGPLWDGPPAPAGRCNVPMAIARERGCPLAVEALSGAPERGVDAPRPPEDDAAGPEAPAPHGEDGGTTGAGDAPSPGPVEPQAEIAAIEAAIDRAEGTLRERRGAARELDARLSDLLAHTASKEAAVREAEELLEEARAAERDTSGVEERRRERAARMGDVTDKRAAMRRTHAEALARLSERFDGVLRALLGDGVRGRVEVTREGIELIAAAQGDRESAALDTIKVLALDLAALGLGIEGHGHFPGFLVHDGPREADMDQAVYDRLFLLALQMEEAFSGAGAIGFQYIVTTTTPPPERARRAPWLLDPVLDASTEEGRLLGMNL